MPTSESTSQESGYQKGRRSAAVAHLAKPAPNLSHPQRIVSYVTTTPRSSSNSSMSRRPRLNRKYQRTPPLMTAAGKR
jgi:hypothetical protein